MMRLLPFVLVVALAQWAAAHTTGHWTPHTTRVEVSSASETATTHEVTVSIDPTATMEVFGAVTYDAKLYPPPGGVPTTAASVSGVGKAATSFTFTLPRPSGDHDSVATFGTISLRYHTSVDAEDDDPWGGRAVFEVVSNRVR